MFVQNQITELDNHRSVIVDAIKQSDKLFFVVAYVRENGVNIILDEIKNKSTKLICSFDMGITQLSGIKKLLESGVKVKVYHSNEGTFHPKMWLFGNKKQWKILIGSANLTRAALVDNVEASVLLEDKNTVTNAVMFFNFLWNAKNSQEITLEEAEILRQQIEKRREIRNEIRRLQEASAKEKEKAKVLLQFVKQWISIPKIERKDIGTIWRGWYIIPDHGYVKDDLIKNMKDYLPFIDGGIKLDDKNKRYLKLLQTFRNNSKFQRKILKMSMHQLFVRQAKNYLIKFGWACHPIDKRTKKPVKNILFLTSLGEQINQCKNLKSVKHLYTEYFSNYSYNGLYIVEFTRSLLKQLNYLSLDEFNYFAIHAYNTDDLDTIVNLVNIYRSLSDSGRDFFEKSAKDYFLKNKEQTAKNVHGNYLKSVKHTITAIAWCNGFHLRQEDFTVRIDNESQ